MLCYIIVYYVSLCQHGKQSGNTMAAWGTHHTGILAHDHYNGFPIINSFRAQLSFDSRKFKIEEMMFQVHLTTMQLENTYEMQGRNIDEELA